MPENLEPVRINSFKQPDSNVFEPIRKKKESKILHLQLFTGKVKCMEKQEGFFCQKAYKKVCKNGDKP